MSRLWRMSCSKQEKYNMHHLLMSNGLVERSIHVQLPGNSYPLFQHILVLPWQSTLTPIGLSQYNGLLGVCRWEFRCKTIFSDRIRYVQVLPWQSNLAPTSLSHYVTFATWFCEPFIYIADKYPGWC